MKFTMYEAFNFRTEKKKKIHLKKSLLPRRGNKLLIPWSQSLDSEEPAFVMCRVLYVYQILITSFTVRERSGHTLWGVKAYTLRAYRRKSSVQQGESQEASPDNRLPGAVCSPLYPVRCWR